MLRSATFAWSAAFADFASASSPRRTSTILDRLSVLSDPLTVKGVKMPVRSPIVTISSVATGLNTGNEAATTSGRTTDDTEAGDVMTVPSTTAAPSG